MLVLAIDTAGKQGGAALYRALPRLIEVAHIGGGTFSASLIPQVSALLARCNLGKKEIGGIAVVHGPGSFTGIRVGLAAAKALGETMGIPIATVSSLELIASAAADEHAIAAIDAGRREAYYAEYHRSDDGATRVLGAQGEQIGAWEQLVAYVQASGRMVVTPDQALAEYLAAHSIAARQVTRPDADRVAFLGLPKLKAGNTVPVEVLDANYLRASDAELFSKPLASKQSLSKQKTD
jgi:tRNA threonylcarbamoyladenosine biosynthesis protein TsaB